MIECKKQSLESRIRARVQSWLNGLICEEPSDDIVFSDGQIKGAFSFVTYNVISEISFY